MPPPKPAKKPQGAKRSPDFDVEIGEAEIKPGLDVDIGEAEMLPEASDPMGFDESLGDLETMGEMGEGGVAWSPVLLPNGEIGFKPKSMEAATGPSPQQHDPRLNGQRTVPFTSPGKYSQGL
jgi:hypothetical protein